MSGQLKQVGGMKANFACILLCACLSACANPYNKFYSGSPDARANPYYVDMPGDVAIYPTNDLDRDGRALIRKGYFIIGNSSFNGASNNVSNQQLIEQAKKVGAQVVLLKSKYTHTETGAMPLTLPNTSTSYSTGNATAYGAGGMVNAYGSATTTTFGSETVMMPYSVQRSDYLAVYFAKSQSRLGVCLEATTSIDIETRKRLGTNAGVKVFEVIEGSPAYRANVFPGDILLSIGNDEFSSQEEYIKLLDKYEGQKVSVKLWRDGNILEKNLEVLSIPKADTKR
jgi:hypothetical protein